MYKAMLLSVVVLWCLSPSVLANLGQEIAQTSEEEVAATIEEDLVLEDEPIDLPEFEVALNAVEPGFDESRLGSALSSPVDDIEGSAQFIIGFWHQLVLDLQLADYSRTDELEQEISAPENPGPCYASRAMAMVHLAMYDAYVGVTGDADTYLTYSPASLPTGVDVAILPIAAAAAAGSAAALTLAQLYQNPDDQQAIEDSRQSFVDGLVQFGDVPFVSDGDPWPMTVANAIIQDRRIDGAGDPDRRAFLPASAVNGGSTATYKHVPDPTAEDPENPENDQLLYAPHWGLVKPFMHSKPSLPSIRKDLPEEFDGVPFPSYATDLQAVLSIGQDIADEGPNPARTPAQTITGLFWAYDGGFQIGVPPRLYNSVADDVIIDLVGKGAPQLATGYQLVRLYAMINAGLADAGISAWKDKYFYNFWRPIIGIRRANEDPATADFQDTEWQQLGAPNTNRNRPGINPAFPAYPSGHATFGTAVLEIVKQVLSQPAPAKFEFFSDEFNGVSIDDEYCAKPFAQCLPDDVRPVITKTLTIDEAIKENSDSRIFLGVHWEADQTTGRLLGQKIAANIVANFPNKS